MSTVGISPVGKPATTANGQPATPPPNRSSKVRGFLGRRTWWLIGALLVAAAGALSYYWIFGKAKIVYSTAPVVRGDIESTV